MHLYIIYFSTSMHPSSNPITGPQHFRNFNGTCAHTLLPQDRNPGVIHQRKQYSSPSILQPFILRPPLIIRPLDLVPKGNFLC